ASPEELAKASPKDPDGLLALARKLHQRWGELAAAERSSSPLNAPLSAAVRDALSVITETVNLAGRLDLLLISVDLALAANPPDLDRARKALGEAQALSTKRPSGDAGIIELRFRQFQLARAVGDKAVAREHASWLVAQPGAASRERACLTVLAE